METCYLSISFRSPRVEAWEWVEWAWAQDSCPLDSAPQPTLLAAVRLIEGVQTVALGIGTVDEDEGEAWAVIAVLLDRLLRSHRDRTKVIFPLFVQFISIVKQY